MPFLFFFIFVHYLLVGLSCRCLRFAFCSILTVKTSVATMTTQQQQHRKWEISRCELRMRQHKCTQTHMKSPFWKLVFSVAHIRTHSHTHSHTDARWSKFDDVFFYSSFGVISYALSSFHIGKISLMVFHSWCIANVLELCSCSFALTER